MIRYSTGIIKLKNNILSNSSLKKDNKKSSNIKDDNINKPVKVKIIVPMEDKKNAKKMLVKCPVY